MTSVSFRTTVKRCEERTRVKSAHKTGRKLDDGKDEIETERELIGYGVLLEHSYEWLVFDTWPDFKTGDKVEVIIRKIDEAKAT